MPDPTPLPLPTASACNNGIHGNGNYVNMQFAESLQLYENAKELEQTQPQPVLVLVKEETKVQVHEVKEPEPVTMETVEKGKEATETEKQAEVLTSQTQPEYENLRKDSGVAIEVEKDNSEPTKETEGASANPPIRRSSSVPCKKGGHANRDSASSSDSGVSGDCALFIEESPNTSGSVNG